MVVVMMLSQKLPVEIVIQTSWLGVYKVWKHVADVVSWKIGDGRKSNFWNDYWFKKGIVLKEAVTMPLNESELVKTVNDFIQPTGEWNMCQIKQFLP